MAMGHRAHLGAPETYEIPPYLECGKPYDGMPGPYPRMPGNRVTGNLLVLVAPNEAFSTRQAVAPALDRCNARPGIQVGWATTVDVARDNWRYPRGVAWTDLPMALPPMTKLRGDGTVGIFTVDGCHYMGLAPLRHGIEEPKAVLMVLPARSADDGFPGGMEAAMDLAALVELIECNDLGRLPLLLDDGELRAVTLDELKDATAWVEPWRRFLYSWSFNFAAIGSKALLGALSQATESEGEASSLLQRGPYDRREGRRLLESTREWAGSASASMGPLELQVLYRLRRLGRVDASHCIGPYGVQGMPALSAILATPSGGLEWTGTGKHPALPINWRKCAEVSAFLVKSLLIDVRDGRLGLSETGERFLGMLHPDCEDADLPCRWMGRPLDATDSAALDASLIRTFRKLKRRVNALGLDKLAPGVGEG